MIDFTRKKSPLAHAFNNYELSKNNNNNSSNKGVEEDSKKQKKKLRKKSGDQVFDLSRDGESSFER